jgi:hypothetical protein
MCICLKGFDLSLSLQQNFSWMHQMNPEKVQELGDVYFLDP